MHTDEYEISILREIDVCSKEIGRLKKYLAEMEKKSGIISSEFEDAYLSGKLPRHDEDFAVRYEKIKSFKEWQKRKNEYDEILRRMKI